jgi:hypothetical protein
MKIKKNTFFTLVLELFFPSIANCRNLKLQNQLPLINSLHYFFKHTCYWAVYYIRKQNDSSCVYFSFLENNFFIYFLDNFFLHTTNWTKWYYLTVEICLLRYLALFALIAHFKISGFKATTRGSKCVARCPFAGITLLLSAKSIFCQWVNNGRCAVHQGHHTF